MSNEDQSDAGDRVEVSSLQPGWLVGDGRYTLTRVLARGGMGVVWLARDEQLREKVALKFLPPDISHDATALEGLRHETARARKLTHPNIVGIFDFFKGRHETFIAMEFVEGFNLGELRLHQPNGVFPWEVLQPMVMQLSDALDYAHNEGVIHRDIKPANLILDPKGRLKLADFGLSVQVMDALDHATRCHAQSGTVTYMSPQQMNGEAPKATDDIYALGATLFELLTSRPPFVDGDVSHQVRNCLAPSLRERLAEIGIDNEVPAAVAALIMACLAKDPLQRPQSARAVADWIAVPEARPKTRFQPQPVLSTPPSTVRKAGDDRPVAPPDFSGDGKKAAKEGAPPRIEQTPWLWIGLAGAVMLAGLFVFAGLIVWLWLRQAPDHTGEFVGKVPVEAGALSSQAANRVPRLPADELSFAAHSAGVCGVAMIRSGEWIASASIDDTLRISNARTGAPVWTRPAGQRGVRAIAVSPDDRLLASGGFDSTVRLWALENGAAEKTLSGHRAAVSQVRFATSADHLASGDEQGGVTFWNYQTAEPLLSWRAHAGEIRALAFSPDGKWLATGGGKEANVRLWILPDAIPGPVLSAHDDILHSLAFSPDGKWLASASHDRSLCVWNSLDWKLERRVQYKTRSHRMAPLTFSPDSRFVAAGKAAGEITIFDIHSASIGEGRDLSPPAAGQGDINALFFAWDGSAIVAGDSRGRIHVLPFDPEDLFPAWK